MFDSLFDFNATMRCDRCQARALTMALHDEHASELLFCAHHTKVYGPALISQGWELIHDTEGYEEINANHNAGLTVKD